MTNDGDRLKKEAKQIGKALLTAMVFVVIFAVVLVLKRWISPSSILFYEGLRVICYLVIFSVITCIGLQFTRLTVKAHADHATILGILLGCVLAYAFHITVPTNLERSFSITMLSLLRAHEESVKELQCNFLETFVIHGAAIEKRVNEQIVTGNVILNNNNGKIQLTDRGIALTSLWVALAKLFSINLDWVDAKPSSNCEGYPSNP